MPKFACGRILVPDVSSPVLGFSGSRGTEKKEMEISVTIGVNGEFFAFWGFLSYISATRGRIHTKFHLYMDDVCRCALSLSGFLGSIDPWGRWRGSKKLKKWGWSHSCCEQLPFSVFLSVAKCSSICRAQTCAHSGIKPSRSVKAILQGGPKVRKIFEFFTIFSFYVPYISPTAKNRNLQAAYVAYWPSL